MIRYQLHVSIRYRADSGRRADKWHNYGIPGNTKVGNPKQPGNYSKFRDRQKNPL